MLILPRGHVKPPLGAELDFSHPFARNLLFCVPMLGASWYTSNLATIPDLIVPVWGSTPRRTVSLKDTSGNPYGSNLQGTCVVGNVGTTISMGPDPIPADKVTICVVRRKRDTTHRTGSLFSSQSAVEAELVTAFAPYSDGVVYWEFGGLSSPPDYISAAGLSFSTTIPEKWIFIAGPRGMAIWQNGVKVASTTTANPGRTVNTARDFHIGALASGAGDVQDFNYFAAYNDEWSDSLCRWWSAEPYAALYRPMARHIFDFGAAGGGASTFPALTVAI